MKRFNGTILSLCVLVCLCNIGLGEIVQMEKSSDSLVVEEYPVA